MPSDRDKQLPRPNPQIGAELGVDRAPLSERSRRASESAGQSSLSYATSGPTNVPAPAQVQTDMPPVILDPVTAPPDESPEGVRLAFESARQVKAHIPSPPASSRVSAPRVIAEPANAASGSFKAAAPILTPAPAPASLHGPSSGGASGGTPRPPLVIGDLPPMRSPTNTVVVRERRASPVEKAVAFAVALLLMCLVGAIAFWWGRQ